ncbi:ribonuclease H protein [Trifolium medium]|uniref:Ribonuclease H protein n=1 Tax=Trifolium medium TaxID=97028 RepID=A0A392NQA3_9FABA|nr:ribonuclease H protein [Trifolium medium]
MWVDLKGGKRKTSPLPKEELLSKQWARSAEENPLDQKDYLCRAKKEGGLGFRTFKAFNEAILAKQGWRLITNPHSLLAQTLKAKYYPKMDIINSSIGYNPSYTWRSVYHAMWVIRKGVCWRVGNGHTIRVWEDRWLPFQNTSQLLTPKPEATNIHMVRDLMLEGTKQWNQPLIENLFYSFEANQIQKLPIPSMEEEDRVM